MSNTSDYRSLRDRQGIERRRFVLLVTLLILSAMPTLHNGASTRGQCQTGTGLFDYGPHRDDPESEQLAMALTGQLRAPDYEYGRIRRDLALIRSTNNLLTAVVNDPDYALNHLIVGMDTTLPWTAYEALNDYYQVIEDRVIFTNPQIRLLTFCDNLNAQALAIQYEPLQEVSYAEPDFNFGTEHRITITPSDDLYRYEIEDGFEDCLAGCICSRTWVFDVTAWGTVQFVSYGESGPLPWCPQDPGPCCMTNAACEMLTADPCLQQGGVPLGPGRACGGGESVCGPPPIPAVSAWGLIILSLLLLVAGQVCIERRGRGVGGCQGGG